MPSPTLIIFLHCCYFVSLFLLTMSLTRRISHLSALSINFLLLIAKSCSYHSSSFQPPYNFLASVECTSASLAQDTWFQIADLSTSSSMTIFNFNSGHHCLWLDVTPKMTPFPFQIQTDGNRAKFLKWFITLTQKTMNVPCKVTKWIYIFLI